MKEFVRIVAAGRKSKLRVLAIYHLAISPHEPQTWLLTSLR